MRKSVMVWLLAFLLAPAVHAQQDMFKALFLYNFTKNIEWPAAYQQGEFVISVLGNDGISDELSKLMANKKINNQEIKITQLTNLSAAPKAHIVFVSPSKSGSLAAVMSYYKGKPTLIVAQKENGCRDGAGINFVVVDGKIKYEICPRHNQAQGLLVNQKLMSLGIVTE
ncbi:MAG: YfiR family protein [Marinilabiliaceae bacterium]|nr:YfiR family protein [Marinilabiliaceae bacterium]